MTEVAHGSGELPQEQSQSYYQLLAENQLVKQAVNVYSQTKDVHPLINSAFSRGEEIVGNVTNYATQKAVEGYNSYYVQPKTSITNAYTTGAEKTRTAVENGKNAVIVGGTMSIGAAVVLTQFSLAMSAGGAALVLDGVGAAQNAGTKAISAVRSAEQTVEQKIYTAIENTQKIAMIPLDKVTESSNALLDILDTVVERGLQVQVTDPENATIRQRVSNLAAAIVQALSHKAHESVIDPVNNQVRGLVENLVKSFALADAVRAKQEWVREKVTELSSSVSELKEKLEVEAAQYKQRPEEVLMKSIKTTSSQLKNRLQLLRTKGNLVLGDGNRIDSAISYLEGLDTNLSEADTIYKVRDEVISEARQKLAELTTWASSLLMINGDVWVFDASDMVFRHLDIQVNQHQQFTTTPRRSCRA